MRGAQVIATLGGPDSVLGQAHEARRWTEWLLWGTGQPRGPAEWELKLKGLVDQVHMLPTPLLRLLVTAGGVGGGVGPGGACQGQAPS